MGFIFSNITQLADFFISEQAATAQASKITGSQTVLPEFDFDALLRGCLSPKSQMAVPITFQKLTPDVQKRSIPENIGSTRQNLPEEKIRTSIPINIILGAIIEDERPITLKFPKSKIESINSESAAPMQLPSIQLDKISTIVIPNSDLSAAIQFLPSQVIKASRSPENEIAVNINYDDAQPEAKYVKISNLIDLISQYPEPITIEISNIHNENEIKSLILNTSRNTSTENIMRVPQLIKSSFSFDFKQLLLNSEESNVRSIQGIIIQTILSDQELKTTYSNYIPAEQVESKLPDHNEIAQKAVSELKQLYIRQSSEPAIAVSDDHQPAVHYRPEQLTKSLAQPQSSIPVRSQKDRIKNIEKNEKSNELKFISDKPEILTPHISAGPQNEEESILINRPLIRDSRTSKQVPNKEGFIRPSDESRRFSISELSKSIQNDSPDSLTRNIETLKNVIVEGVKKNTTIIRLRLQPEKLGDLNIRMQFSKEAVVIRILADSKETADIIKSAIPELKAGLESQNIKVQEITATPGGHNLASNSGGPGQNFRDADTSGNPRNFSGQFRDDSNRQYHPQEKPDTPALLQKPRAKSNRWIDYEA